MPRLLPIARGLLMLALLVAAPLHAADVLQQVPANAIGFVVVRDLSRADNKANKLFRNVQIGLPGPLTLIKSFTGGVAGLDVHRDMLVAMLPRGDSGQEFQLAAWLPVKDYAKLVRSLEGDPERRIAAVTVAGEELLVAQHGDWAVVTDPDQREWLAKLPGDAAAPTPEVARWGAWVDQNDATLVVLPAGMRTAASAIMAQSGLQTEPQSAGTGDDLFGPPPESPAAAAGKWAAARDALRTLLASEPNFARWAGEARGAAVGLRMSDDDKTVVGVRLDFPEGTLPPMDAERATISPPQLVDKNHDAEYVISGSGLASPRWTVPAVGPYVRESAGELQGQLGVEVEAESIAEFRRTVEQAVGQVSAFSVLWRCGEGQEGVFTNSFLALRVDSSKEFLERALAAVDQWNAMVGKSRGPLKLAFTSKPTTIGARTGKEYSIDMAVATGAPGLPEVRQSMEKLFGPGGVFRLQFIAVDDHTVLLAAATEEQAAKAIDAIVANDAAGAGGKQATTSGLLDGHADWQISASPHGYTTWLRRQMDAVLGQVIGGPVVREFPASPPVAIAGSADGQTISLKMSAQPETLRGLGEYARNYLQQQRRRMPR